MNRLSAVALGVGAIWLLSKSAKASALTRMTFRLVGVSVGGSLLSPELDLQILAQNATDTAVNIQSMTGDVFVNGSKVANLSSFQAFRLQANSETPFSVKARLNLAGSLTQILSILDGVGGTQAVVTIKGTINADGVVVPIDITYKLI